MILDCPFCGTSHSKSSAEVGSGLDVPCRKCSKVFHVDGSGKIDTDSAGNGQDGGFASEATDILSGPGASLSAAARAASGFDDDDSSDSGFGEAAGATAVLDARGLKEHLTAMKSPEPEPAPAAKPSSGGGARAPAESPPEGGFHQAPTGLINTATLKDTLEQMRADAAGVDPGGEQGQAIADTPDDSFEDEGPPVFGLGPRSSPAEEDPTPREPRVPLSQRVREFVAALGALAPQARIGLGIAAGALSVFWILVTALLVSGGEERVYVLDRQPLMSEAHERQARQVALLQRGAVLVVHEELEGQFLVRDALGRAGFVPRRTVSDTPPAAEPEFDFADCLRAEFEVGTGACLARGQRQFESCRGVCETRHDRDACLNRCQDRLNSCSGSCDGQVNLAPPEPSLEGPSAESGTAVEGTKGTKDSGPSASPSPPPKKKTSSDKKSRRKKRKKRRR